MWFSAVGMGATPSAREILRRTAEAYRNLHSYELHVTIQTVQGAQVAERRLTASGTRPGKFRLQDDGADGELHLGDGSTEWTFSPAANEYAKAPMAGEALTPISEFEQIDRHVSEANVARKEKFIVDGQAVPIYVVRVARDQWPEGSLPGAQFAMYRIDQKTYAVYKAITYAPGVTQIALYSIANWNRSVPDTLFTFKPPESARETRVVAARATQSASLTGGEAPDFVLRDTGGREVRLSALRGKVVIVDFWATWCQPCRALMPRLQQMYRDLGDKGLVILGLDAGEDTGTVSVFAKEHSYTFPLLLDAEPDVTARYYVEAYPTTFVIDRKGRIAFRDMAGEKADNLQAAVETALREGL